MGIKMRRIHKKASFSNRTLIDLQLPNTSCADKAEFRAFVAQAVRGSGKPLSITLLDHFSLPYLQVQTCCGYKSRERLLGARTSELLQHLSVLSKRAQFSLGRVQNGDTFGSLIEQKQSLKPPPCTVIFKL